MVKQIGVRCDGIYCSNPGCGCGRVRRDGSLSRETLYREMPMTTEPSPFTRDIRSLDPDDLNAALKQGAHPVPVSEFVATEVAKIRESLSLDSSSEFVLKGALDRAVQRGIWDMAFATRKQLDESNSRMERLGQVGLFAVFLGGLMVGYWIWG